MNGSIAEKNSVNNVPSPFTSMFTNFQACSGLSTDPSTTGGGTYSLIGSTNMAYDRVPSAAQSGCSINGVPASGMMLAYDIAANARQDAAGYRAAGAYERTAA